MERLHILETEVCIDNLMKTNNNLLEETGMDIYLGKKKQKRSTKQKETRVEIREQEGVGNGINKRKAIRIGPLVISTHQNPMRVKERTASVDYYILLCYMRIICEGNINIITH